MPVIQQEKTKRDTLNLRIKPDLRGLIDRAAELSGKNRTDFVLDAARHGAQAILRFRLGQCDSLERRASSFAFARDWLSGRGAVAARQGELRRAKRYQPIPTARLNSVG